MAALALKVSECINEQTDRTDRLFFIYQIRHIFGKYFMNMRILGSVTALSDSNGRPGRGFGHRLWQRFSLAGSPGRMRRENGAGPDWELGPRGGVSGGSREDVTNYSTQPRWRCVG